MTFPANPLPYTGLWSDFAILSDDLRKARFGVGYVQALSAHAGLGFVETGSDQDVLAVDCTIGFPEATVQVQVKCTSTLKLHGRSASWHIKPTWNKLWNVSKGPVYLVIVMVPKDFDAWIDHSLNGTNLSKTAAFWVRVDNQSISGSVNVPKSQRLTVDSFPIWRQDMLSVYK